MKILAVEFSSEHRSVAVAAIDPDVRVLSEQCVNGTRSTPALGLIEAALHAARMAREEIEAIAVGLGPGSYTGIRIAIAMAQGWQLARGVHLLGISSVEVLAFGAWRAGLRGRVTLAVDAHRGEFYLARYELSDAAPRATEALQLATREEVEHRLANSEIVISPEAAQLSSTTAKLRHPQAAELAHLALNRTDFLPGEQLEPIYLRETQFVKAPPLRIITP